MFGKDFTPKECEIFEKMGPWVCKNCKEENDADDMKCNECRIDRRFSTKEFGMPGTIWREYREMYKEAIIKDVPEEIPESAAQHLKSDMERYMYKRTRMLVNLCVQHNAWNTEYDKPSDLVIRLQNLDMGDNISGSIRKARIMDYLEEIYWHANMNLCEVLDGEAELFGYMGLLFRSRHRGGHDQIIKERFEKLKDHPSSKTVKGSKKGQNYIVNQDLQMCSCPSYKYRGGPCKHLVQKKK